MLIKYISPEPQSLCSRYISELDLWISSKLTMEDDTNNMYSMGQMFWDTL